MSKIILVAAVAAIGAIGANTAAADQEPGTVKGKATFKGDALPKRKKIDMSKDERCVASGHRPMTESEIIDKETKGIQNIFVYVKSGHEKMTFETPQTPVEIVQEGCQYKPHVFGVMPGQRIQIKNGDDTTHNIHGLPGKSKEFNFTQNKKGQVDGASLENLETAVKIKCDIHPWMSAWAFVLPHTLFAVTDEKGTFTLPPLPPGEYEIAAWHEVYGELRQKVRVNEKQTTEIEFVFEKK